MTLEIPPNNNPAPPIGREEANQTLRDERFRLLVQGVKDYAIFMLDPHGKVICWNTGAALLFGYTEAEIVDRHYSVFFTAEDIARGEPERELRAAQRPERFEGEVLRVRRDGSTFLANVVIGAVLQEETGQHLGFSQITRDITERKRLEEQLRQSQKMEAIGTLSAGIAHDFNNLLTIINGYAAVLMGTLHDHDENRSSVEEIGKAGDRAALLTRQLLAFSRKQVLTPQILDLDTHLAETISLVKRLLGAGIEVVTEAPRGLWHVKADPGQLEQIVLNLAVNARDAMPEGGRLTIRTANVDFGSAQAGPVGIKPGPYVLLSVRDSGFGMDSATLARMFEPFFTTKEPGKGTGLGLSTVYGAVKQSGGHVEAESVPGKGTTVRVYLPSVEGAAPPPKAEAVGTGVPGGSETVLLVEDEDGIRRLATFFLQKAGYDVLVASSGDEALEIASQYPGAIDLLVSDVVMPGISGLQAASRLSVLHPKMRILFMSGFSESAVTRQGMLRPGTAFLQKPFTPAGLTAKVREVLDG